MADENDPTLKDLFRVINDMRNETNARFDDLRSHMNARFDDAAAERQAMREVIDTLPSEEDFRELDRNIAVVANDAKATRTDARNLKAEVSRLRADVKAAGLPVR